MRRFPWALALLVAAPALSRGQSAADNTDPRVEKVLLAHEEAFRRMSAVEVRLERLTRDRTFKQEQLSRGTLRWLRPSDAAQPTRMSLRHAPADAPEAVDGFVYSGTHLYFFSPTRKEITAFEGDELFKAAPGKAETWNGFLRLAVHSTRDIAWLVGCCDAADARARYRIEWTGEDADYVYLRMTPKVNDPAFSQARVVLSAKTSLPRQLWFQQSPGTEVRWDVTGLDARAKLQAADFREPPLPEGWRFRWPANATPVSRTRPGKAE